MGCAPPLPMNRMKRQGEPDQVENLKRLLARKDFLFYPATALICVIATGGLAAAGGFATPERATLLLLSFVAALTLIGAIVAVRGARRLVNEKLARISEELAWTGMLMEHSNELVVILNAFGQIITYNRNVAQLLRIDRDAVVGMPFREIVYDENLDKNLRMNDIILRKLGEVFSGRETDLTCFSKRRGTEEIITINYRLIPVFKNELFDNILAVGRIIQGDVLSTRYLQREYEYYRLDNNIALVFQLCMRLTRNLEGKLPKNQVLMAQVALQEVLINAIEHGNLEIDYHMKTELKSREGNYWELLLRECNQEHLRIRKIHVSYTLEPDRVLYVIRDEGSGFDWRGYLGRDMTIIDQELMRNMHGLGLQFARNIFDVTFNESGTEVTLAKQFANTAPEP